MPQPGQVSSKNSDCKSSTAAESTADYLTIKELARKSGLSTKTLHRYKERGTIEFYQPGGHGCVLLFPPDCIERATADGQVGDDVSPRRRTGPKPKWMDGLQIETCSPRMQQANGTTS